jgi:mono/diheme cytochrome c family protein
MHFFRKAVCLVFISLAQLACANRDEAQPAAAAGPVGDPERGQELFLSDMGCNICHGENAKGSVGPNIRQVTIEKVYHALQNFPDMMNWQFNFPELFEEQSLLDIVAYLQTLEKEPAE